MKRHPEGVSKGQEMFTKALASVLSVSPGTGAVTCTSTTCNFTGGGASFPGTNALGLVSVFIANAKY